MGMQKKIETKLVEELNPSYLEVVNESYRHKGHQGDDGSGESHFKVVVSSQKFDELNRIDRERLIFDILKDEMKIIHALSIKIK